MRKGSRRDLARREAEKVDEELDKARAAIIDEFSSGREKPRIPAGKVDEELDKARAAIVDEFSSGREKPRIPAGKVDEELDKARAAIVDEFSSGREKPRIPAGKVDEELDKARAAIIDELPQKEDLKEVPVEDLGGGLNEASPPTEIAIRECLIAENTRVSEDGKRKEKRAGLTKLDSLYDFVSKKVYGAFGIEESDEVKIAAFLEDDIQLKSGNAWGSIFSPTKTINKPVSIVQDKGLVLVAGYEKPITIKEGVAFYSGIEAPLSAPTVAIGDAGAEKKLTEYATSNQDHCSELGQGVGQTLLAQSFKPTVDCELSKITLKLRKVGSPTGNMWAEIHESKSNTSASKNTSPAINGQATDNLDVSTIRGSFAEVEDTSIAFVSATKKITDSNDGLAGFLTGDTIKVSGSAHNDGFYTIDTGAVAGEIVVTEDLIDESAGDSIKVETVYRLTFSGTAPDLKKDKTYYLVLYRSVAPSSTNFVVVAFDNSSPEYEDGKYWEIDDSLDWGGYASVDLVFEVHGVDQEEKELASFGPVETGRQSSLRYEDTTWLLAQSFLAPFSVVDISKIKIPLKKICFQGCPPGNLWLEVHSSQVGTSKTKEASTNIVGEASDDANIANDITEDHEWVEFTFSGTKPSLTLYETTVDETSLVGQKVLKVASTANYAVGGLVTIGRGTERQEEKLIASIQAGVSLTMSKNLVYSHTQTQADIVENVYLIVLYWTSNKSSPDRYVTWTRHEGYADGQMWVASEGMSWIKGSGDFPFEVIGYETSEITLVEYALSNLDHIKELREANGATLLAQEFLVYEDTEVTKVKLYLSKVGSLTGKFVWAEIHGGHGGTSTSKGQSDDIVGKASGSIDADSLSAFPDYGWVTFTFSELKPDIKAETAYYIVIYGDFDVNLSNYVKVGMDKIAPDYTVGKRWDIDDQLDWIAKEGIDFMFELWTSISDILGEYSYVITYLRGGNYPCESNPSPPSETIELIADKVAELTNIPVSSEPEVTHKNIYRNKNGEEKRYWVERILNSVTEYNDSLPDSGLGDEVSYESYPPPIGNSIEIWDDCLWLCGVEGYPESLFRSRRGYLEQFKSTALSIFPLREDEASPVLRVKEFNNYLYPFKKTSIWVISRSGGSLVVDKMIDGIGTCAGPSVAECGDKKLRFLSNYHEIEEFDGWKLTSMELPNKVMKVLKTINKTYAHRSVARNHAEENEYRLAIPTGSSMVPNKVIVYNYKDKNFFIDTYHQNICSISVLAIEKGVRAILYGTDQGELYKVDPDATTDDGQIINMRFRTGWIGSTQWLTLRKMWVDFILSAHGPGGGSMFAVNSSNKYIDFDERNSMPLVNLFVAVADDLTSDCVMTSPDGITWTIRSSPADKSWRSVTYGNGLFVAVAASGAGNRVMTSPDGITWTIRSSAADNAWLSVTYGKRLFVAVASYGNNVMTSPDGITWTIRSSAANEAWQSVTYGKGLFVAISRSGTGNRVMTSPDGIDWTIRSSAADKGWRSVTYGNGLFVAVADSGAGNRVMTSPDGIDWTIRSSAADKGWYSVTYGNGLFVAVANSGTGDRVMTSPDGINWTLRSSAADNEWHSVTYGNGLFVAVAGSGAGNRVMTSPDGITWTIRSSAANNTWLSVTYRGESNAILTEGNYNANSLCAEIKSKLDAAGLLIHTVTYSESDAKFTISATEKFSLLWKTGSHGSDNADDHIGTLIGFDDSVDDKGLDTYPSDNEAIPREKIIFKVYSNFRDSPELNMNLEGSSPPGADPELRNIIHQRIDMAIKGSFFSFEFINTEDVGDLLQVIKFWLYLKTKPGKRTIKAE